MSSSSSKTHPPKREEVSTQNIVNASIISFTILLILSIGCALYLDYSNPGSYGFSEDIKRENKLIPDQDLTRLKNDITNLCVSIYHFNQSMATATQSDRTFEDRNNLFKKLLASELLLFRFDLEKRFEAFRQIFPIQSNYILPYLNSLIIPFSTFVFTLLLFYVLHEIRLWLLNPKAVITSYHQLVVATALTLNLIILLAGPLVLIPTVDEKMNLGDINVEKCSMQLYDPDNGAFVSKLADMIEALS